MDQMMTYRITVTNTCKENRHIFRIENELRAGAKREPDFTLALHLASCSISAQKDRFAHEESCEVCLAAEQVAS
jgi:hypothetical protein